MPGWGVTPAGFVAKPYAAILDDIEAAQLATMDPGIDLSPTGPQGQQNGIFANAHAALWQLLGTCYNSFNRQAAEGAGLDNLGDLTGTPRGGASYTQVACTLTFSGSTVYPPGTLVANVTGSPSQAFANLNQVTGASSVTGVVMQALTIGATPSVNPGTLTQITNPVGGWTSITNPAAQTQLGANAEIDPAYVVNQEEELGNDGGNNSKATVAAMIALGEAQSPPVQVQVVVEENRTDDPLVVGSLTLPPHSFAVVLYPDPATWNGGDQTQAVGQVIWANKPPGIPSYGTTSVTITDPILGQQTVYYTVPTGEALYISAEVVPRTGVVWSALEALIQNALVAAAVAPTPPGGQPPNGQMTPGQVGSGGYVIGSQLEAVIMAVPGVLDITTTAGVRQLFFAFTATPTNTAPIAVSITSVPTVAAVHVVLTQGSPP